jgi:hypothetical protein
MCDKPGRPNLANSSLRENVCVYFLVRYLVMCVCMNACDCVCLCMYVRVYLCVWMLGVVYVGGCK